jgi:hypothetical protein
VNYKDKVQRYDLPLSQGPSFLLRLQPRFTMAQAQMDYSAEKYTPSQHEDLKHDDAHQIAGHGHAATDMQVQPHFSLLLL